MKIIRLGPNGKLSQKEAFIIGGTFNLFERIKLGGNGSPKMIYLSGINSFDEVSNQSNDIDYISIELHRNGIVLRFKKKSKYMGALIHFDEIKSIKIEVQKTEYIVRGQLHSYFSSNVIMNLNDALIYLEIQPTHHKAGINFFSKSPFDKVLEIITLPIIKAEQHI